MTGKIVKIDELKQSRNRGEIFKRVYFEIAMVDGSTKWAKTDLVPSFRNYKHWKDMLIVGNVLTGLRLKQNQTVDADCRPTLIKKATPDIVKPPVQDKLL